MVEKETLIIKKNSDKFDYIKIETNVKQTYLKSVKNQSKKDTFAVHIIKDRKKPIHRIHKLFFKIVRKCNPIEK